MWALGKLVMKIIRFWRPEGNERQRLKILTKLVVDKLEQKRLHAAEEEDIKAGAVEELLTYGLAPDQADQATRRHPEIDADQDR